MKDTKVSTEIATLICFTLNYSAFDGNATSKQRTEVRGSDPADLPYFSGGGGSPDNA
jgi:hypothetical protein